MALNENFVWESEIDSGSLIRVGPVVSDEGIEALFVMVETTWGYKEGFLMSIDAIEALAEAVPAVLGMIRLDEEIESGI